jgi:glycosyltransferase involved in cell wall biosynthesis
MTALEAMACGAPVVASRGSGLAEACGPAALYVEEPGNAAAWVQALKTIVRDEGLAAQLRRQGLERAAEFSWERTADAVHRALEAAAEGPHRS